MKTSTLQRNTAKSSNTINTVLTIVALTIWVHNFIAIIAIIK